MLVLTKLARFAIVAIVAAGVAFPAAPVAAAKTICVGLVVDARPLNGPVSANCTKVPDGSTGYDVLRAAGHHVGFRQDGLVCTIDSRPANGCAATDADHFWAYFHRAPKSSSWTYSSEGTTTYTPANGSTEGWVWRDGDKATPDNVPYATICPQQASASPAPSPTPSPAASVAPTATHSPRPQPTPSAEHFRHHRAHVSSSPVPPPASTAPIESARPTATVTTQPPDDSSGPPWGLVVGAVVIVGIGGAATWRWRRREVE